MKPMVHCPCCHREWRARPNDRLPLFALKQLAFSFVTTETDVSGRELLGRRRPKHLVEARAMFVWICKTFGPADISYPTIGGWLNKNHASVMYLWREVVPDLFERSAAFQASCWRFPKFAARAQEETTCV